MRAARKSEYASTIHCTSVVVALSSLWMTGSATLTTEPSIKAMLDPRIVATSTHTPTCGAQGVASGAERITPSSHGDFTKLAIFLSPSTRSLSRLGFKRWAFLDQAESFGDGSFKLGVDALDIILWGDIDLNVGIGAIVFYVPADIFEPEGMLWLGGMGTIHKAMVVGDADNAAPGALADQWPQAHQLEAMAKDIAV